MIKYSQIQSLCEELEEIFEANRFESSMIYGCDCGCGGDSIDTDDLDERDGREDAIRNELTLLGIDVDVDGWGDKLKEEHYES